MCTCQFPKMNTIAFYHKCIWIKNENLAEKKSKSVHVIIQSYPLISQKKAYDRSACGGSWALSLP